MKNILKIITLIIAANLANNPTQAFTIPESNLYVGAPVYIENTEPEKYYAIFLPFKEPTNGEVCASISGEELAENNNMRDYGTCFINDAGVFTVIEIIEPFSSSYEDLVENNGIIQEEIITLNKEGEVPITENEEVITDLEQFIEDAEEEIKNILSGLTETDESSESTSSEESVLGAKTSNILAILMENFLVVTLTTLLILSTVLFIYIMKKDWGENKDRK